MKAAILIPARYQSSRYPGKPLAQVRGATGVSKPLIQRSFEAASRVSNIASVHVVTDDERIAEAAQSFGAPVLMTSPECRNGTERCAEALPALGEVDVVVNLQGDALLTPPHYVEALLERMADSEVMVATPAIRVRSDEVRKLQAEEANGRVGGTAVVVDAAGMALYFSKRLIPYLPDGALKTDLSPLRLHIGVYAYRPQALRDYAATAVTELETLEGLEQLRFIVSGTPVSVVDVPPPTFVLRELNNPEDLEPIEQALADAGLE